MKRGTSVVIELVHGSVLWAHWSRGKECLTGALLWNNHECHVTYHWGYWSTSPHWSHVITFLFCYCEHSQNWWYYQLMRVRWEHVVKTTCSQNLNLSTSDCTDLGVLFRWTGPDTNLTFRYFPIFWTMKSNLLESRKCGIWYHAHIH